ncbi:flavin reductase family protein [Sphingomonas sp. HH69]
MTFQTEQKALEDAFRNAMRRHASTVAIITTGDESQWVGMAATAVSSVSSDPPTLLIVVNRAASLATALQARKKFCVNLLAERHKDLVSAFGGKLKGQDRFNVGEWRLTPDGLPTLGDALASLVCETVQVVGAATHDIYIGRVVGVTVHPDIDPLVWMDGRMATIMDHM